MLERIDGRIADDPPAREFMPCPTEQTSGGSDLCPEIIVVSLDAPAGSKSVNNRDRWN
jgi:hypothetical protein